MTGNEYEECVEATSPPPLPPPPTNFLQFRQMIQRKRITHEHRKTKPQTKNSNKINQIIKQSNRNMTVTQTFGSYMWEISESWLL